MTNSSTEMIEEKIRFATETIEPDSNFTNALWNKIIQTPQKPERFAIFRQFFPKPVWNTAMALIVAACVVLAIGPQNVAAAFSNLISYLPGLGFVQNDTNTLYIPKPIIQTKDGITLSVDQAVMDTSNVIISYHFENLPKKAGSEASSCFYDRNELVTSDGKTKLPTGGGVQGDTARVEFAPLPKGEKEIRLHIAQNIPDPQCKASAEWYINLSFGSKPPSVTLVPVISGEDTRLATAVPTISIPVRNTAGNPVSGSEIHFQIDRIVALGNGYLVTGSTLWENSAWQNVMIDFDSIRVIDANGKPVSIEPTSDGWTDNHFNFNVIGNNDISPLTMQVGSVTIFAKEGNSTAFSFEAGNDPKIGQKWSLNKELNVLGNTITIESIETIQNNPENEDQKKVEDGYVFKVKANPDTRLDFKCIGQNQGQNLGGYWGSSKNLEESVLQIQQFYSEGLLKGSVSCQVSNFQYKLNGTWQLTWQIP